MGPLFLPIWQFEFLIVEFRNLMFVQLLALKYLYGPCLYQAANCTRLMYQSMIVEKELCEFHLSIMMQWMQ
jgi:hypothetical protein